ncbi:stage II sporulation protein D [Calditerricola satsumensis]|uniref:Stage II sporulation protein D n=1 Tax=Calditerricola satsumensis TaxID=373054 RepID=A0A8J3FA12_9BACI|nr:stage II sporulation protein D [Calditerricola satsumensis]GGJ95973.1 stage II sporulation protein D [Calditerricola satsumensis]
MAHRRSTRLWRVRSHRFRAPDRVPAYARRSEVALPLRRLRWWRGIRRIAAVLVSRQAFLVALAFVATAMLVLVFPAALVLVWGPGSAEWGAPATKRSSSLTPHPVAFDVRVYRAQANRVDTVPLEDYVAGVVAAEMPAEFELEALKAQALAARTFVVHRLLQDPKPPVPGNAHVTDTVQDQVYRDPRELRAAWGADFAWKWARIRRAVEETAGLILTYDGEPILAAFFSTASGKTESAADYWGRPLPYLRSVPSPWDEASPRFRQTVTFPWSEFTRKMGLSDLPYPGEKRSDWAAVERTTAGGNVAEVRFGNRRFTGREVRERLGLPSTHFSWTVADGKIVFHTRGYGHGVGMSQWGAQGMARSGKTAEEILQHYYRGVRIEPAARWLNGRNGAQPARAS